MSAEKAKLAEEMSDVFGKFDHSDDTGSLPSYGQSNDTHSRHLMPPPQPNPDGASHYPMAYYNPQEGTINGGQRTDQGGVVFMPGSHSTQRSFLWPILISCFTFWFCGFFLGALAFIFASEYT